MRLFVFFQFKREKFLPTQFLGTGNLEIPKRAFVLHVLNQILLFDAQPTVLTVRDGILATFPHVHRHH